MYLIKRQIIIILLSFFVLSLYGQEDPKTYFPVKEEFPCKLPKKENFWIFIMAGQSNMAGRGLVEPQDTIPSSRILTINEEGEWILAKEPLHWYQPEVTGLDCGVEFGRALIQNLNDSIYIGLVPCAIGGSSVAHWLNDSLFNGVYLYSNFLEKLEISRNYGTVKGILWHQGEADTRASRILTYQENLENLFLNFRKDCENDSIPIFLGELGTYYKHKCEMENYQTIDAIIRKVSNNDPNIFLIETHDLKSKENDPYHFSNASQRLIGQRFAELFLNFIKVI